MAIVERPSGFDYLRISLAIAVIAVHSVSTTEGPAAAVALFDTPLAAPIRVVLPMFFALSGFLVASSLQRSRTLFSFLGLRFLRIYPALAVEVFLSAFLIGTAITNLSLGEYFASPIFHSYMLNVTGHVHYYLPGVFEDNPVTKVNAQLWTVPFELFCYVVITGLGILGVANRRPYLAPLAVIVMSLFGLWEQLVEESDSTRVKGIFLVTSFLCGIVLYLYREKVKWNLGAFSIASILALACLYLEFGHAPGVIFASYATIWLGLSNPPRIMLIRGVDYSYGAFLYGFVIQQLYAYLLPDYRSWWLSMLVCVPASILVAAFSWHLVEKPALKLRKFLFAAENRLFPQASAGVGAVGS